MNQIAVVIPPRNTLQNPSYGMKCLEIPKPKNHHSSRMRRFGKVIVVLERPFDHLVHSSFSFSRFVRAQSIRRGSTSISEVHHLYDVGTSTVVVTKNVFNDDQII